MTLTVKVFRKDGAPVKANPKTGELLDKVRLPDAIHYQILNSLNGKTLFEVSA